MPCLAPHPRAWLRLGPLVALAAAALALAAAALALASAALALASAALASAALTTAALATTTALAAALAAEAAALAAAAHGARHHHCQPHCQSCRRVDQHYQTRRGDLRAERRAGREQERDD